MKLNIGLLKGDGIGPEIVDSAVRVLEKIADKFGHEFCFTPYLIGGAAIDVMCDEPPDVKSRLLQHPKCIVTPHVAAFSCDFEKNFFSHSIEKLRKICGELSAK